MGFFSNLFSEKNCAICGKELGVFGKTKLEDGYLCKDCRNLTSPFWHPGKTTTIEQVKEHIAYREANKDKVAAFQVTRTLGASTKVLIDEDAGTFMVTGASDWRAANPDVIALTDVTGCDWTVKESKTDITPEPPASYNQEGGPQGSGRPQGGGPRPGGPMPGPGMRPGERIYKYDYDFYLTIQVNHPYFSTIEIKINDRDIDSQTSALYTGATQSCEEIKTALMSGREQARERGCSCRPQAGHHLPLLRRHHRARRPGMLRVLRRSAQLV